MSYLKLPQVFEKTPVDVLLFADDLMPRFKDEMLFPSQHFKRIGYKQISDQQLVEYLDDLERELPKDSRPHRFLDYEEVWVTHKTSRPYGVYKLAHELRTHGCTVQVVGRTNHLTEADVRLIFEKFVGDNTLAVGSSGTFHSGYNQFAFIDSIYFPTARQRQIRVMLDEINPNTKMIYGGSPIDVDTLKNPNVDSPMLDVDTIFVAYGDVTIVEYINDLRENREKSIYVDRTSRLDIQNSTMLYTPEDCFEPDDEYGIETARGCIFKCAFCNFGLIGKQKGTYERKPSVIADELRRNWEMFGAYRYFVQDDTFNDTNEKIEGVAEAKEASGVPLELTAYMRLDLQHRLNQTDLLLAAGIKSCYYGIESLNAESAKSIGKGWNPDEQMAYIRELKADKFKDVWTFTTFIWGLPDDTRDSLRRDYKKLLDPDYNKFDHVFMNYLFMRNTSSYKIQTLEAQEPTGSAIDRDPESFGYTFSEFDKMVSSSSAESSLRIWTNKHGLTLGTVSRFAAKFNAEYSKMKGWQEKYPFSPPTRILATATQSDNFDNYLKSYWNKIMNIQHHTRY